MTEAVTMTREGDELVLSGALTYATVPTLEKRLHDEFRRRGLPHRMDLASVDRADSAGFALVLDCLARSRLAGAGLTVANPPKQLITLAGLSDALDLLGWTDSRLGAADTPARPDQRAAPAPPET